MDRKGTFLLLAGLIFLVALLDLATPPRLVVLSLMWVPVVASATFARPAMTGIISVWATALTLLVGVLQGYYHDPSYWVRTSALGLAAGVAVLLAHSARTREQELLVLATTDTLTGLANRHSLLTWLDVELTEDRETPLAVLYLDLDGFKSVNTRHGHAGGDAVLVEVARRLATEVDEHAIVARPGGDEFVVASLLDSQSAGAAELCERLIARVAQRPLAPSDTPVGTTIGAIIVLPPTDLTAEDILDRADALLMGLKEARPGSFAIQQIG